jgi:Domain of unknown function (DUF5597)/Glycosyl hydrolases family 35
VSVSERVSGGSGIEIRERQLTIDGTPVLLLGGELHNSSSSTPEEIARRLDKVKELNLNTVLAPVTWEFFEPQEGTFDFTLVDSLVLGARERGLKLIPLWFGSWKNGLSSYRPAWVKRDPQRFPLVRTSDGQRLQILSAFSAANRDADARAFAVLMRHIREIDLEHHTVVMVQVENEVGILGTSRDHGAEAQRVYESPVDSDFITHLESAINTLKPSIRAALVAGTGTPTRWAALFGESYDTDELFQALAYARYVGGVAAAGRAEYDIPMYTNAWLDSIHFAAEASYSAPTGRQIPGTYPSGGPLPQTFAAWKFAAPSLSFLAPDIYRGDFASWCSSYAAQNDALFIPEMMKDPRGIADIHVAIGQYRAIGTSPFGVDGTDGQFARESSELFAEIYDRLGNISAVILTGQRDRQITGFRLDAEQPTFQADLGGYRLTITRDVEHGAMSDVPESWGLLVADGPGRYFGLGAGYDVAVGPAGSDRPNLKVAFENVRVGRFVDGEWMTTQYLNGDETVSGETWRFPYLKVSPAEASFGEASPTLRILRCSTYEY